MSKSHIMGAIIGVLLIAGALFLVNKSNLSTEEIFSKVTDELYSQKLVREKVDASFVIKDKNVGIYNDLPEGVYPKITFSLDQVFSGEYLKDPSIDFEAAAGLKLLVENLTEDPISVKADFLMFGEMLLYLRLNEFSGAPVDLSSVMNKWWKVDMETLIKNFGGKEADEILESIRAGQISKEKIQQLQEIVKKYKNAFRLEKLADGKIEASPAYRFNVIIDKSQLAQVIKEVFEVMQVDSLNKQEIKISDIEKGLEAITINSLEVLVHKKKYLPVQAKLSLSIADEKKAEIGTMDMSIIFSGSEPVEIVPPAESTDILYLIGNLMNTLNGALPLGTQ